MWQIFTSLVLVLCVGTGTAFAQTKEHYKKGPPQQKPNAAELFQNKDKDHNGKISKTEFIGKAKDDPERLKQLEKRFDAIDVNKDGYIALDEFKTSLTKHKHTAVKQPGKQRPPQKNQHHVI